MDHHRNFFRRHPVQVHGFYDLQPLVHQGGGVHGDFSAHGPIGVFQGVLHCYANQFPPFFSVEGPAGAGQNQPLDLAPVPVGFQALEQGGVLRVHGVDFGPVVLGFLQHQRPGADQRLLVGQADPLALPDGSQGRPQARHPHQGGDGRVGGGDGGRLQHPLQAAEDLDVGVGQPDPQVGGGFFVRQGGQGGPVLPGLLLHQLDAGVGRQRRYLHAAGGNHLQ